MDRQTQTEEQTDSLFIQVMHRITVRLGIN